jgi:dCTP deaminase
MAILPDHEIHQLCAAGMVTPFDPSLVNPASLDLRLGGQLLIESCESPQLVPYPLDQHSESDPYLLQPGQFVLAQTVETFNLPPTTAAQFVLKSSRAREGLEHLMAGFADPGFNNSVLTLELHNSRQLHCVPIWAGMKIGQLVFMRMASAPLVDYSVTGHYNNDRTVTASKGHR